MWSHYHLEGCAARRKLPKKLIVFMQIIRASIKGPITILRVPLNTLRCYPCRKFPLNYRKTLLFHGGDTGSAPVQDATTSNVFARVLFYDKWCLNSQSIQLPFNTTLFRTGISVLPT